MAQSANETSGETSASPMHMLSEQHQHVRNLAAGIRAMTKQPEPTDIQEFGQLRVALSKALRDHFEVEDKALGNAMWSTSGVPSQLLAEWDAQRQQFRQLYSQHLRDWPLSEALRDWKAYGDAVYDCISAGEKLARLEESQIYPLIK